MKDVADSRQATTLESGEVLRKSALAFRQNKPEAPKNALVKLLLYLTMIILQGRGRDTPPQKN